MSRRVDRDPEESGKKFDPEKDKAPSQADRERTYLPHELVDANVPALPGGAQHLWRMSGQVQMDDGYESFTGRYRKTDAVFFRRNGKVFVKPYKAPYDPKSKLQTDQRERFSAAKRQWRCLTPEQRSAWERFATEQHSDSPDGEPVGNQGQSRRKMEPGRTGKRRANPTQLGMNLFTSCQMRRMAWGDAMRAEAPSRPRPGAVTQIREVASPAGTYAFRIEHNERELAGLRVMLEMSPASKSPAHKPMPKHMTRAGTTDAESFFELGDPETIYLLQAPRHNIAPGQRYMVRVTILTEDGLKGQDLQADLIRMAPHE